MQFLANKLAVLRTVSVPKGITPRIILPLNEFQSNYQEYEKLKLNEV